MTDIRRLQIAINNKDAKEIVDTLGFARGLGPDVNEVVRQIRSTHDEAMEVAKGWENLYRHTVVQRDLLLEACERLLKMGSISNRDFARAAIRSVLE